MSRSPGTEVSVGFRVGDFDKLNPRPVSACVLFQPACASGLHARFGTRADPFRVLITSVCWFGLGDGRAGLTTQRACRSADAPG